MNDFLPINADEMKRRGWDAPDFVYITGDAYVDHPSFGPAIISRVLESRGYRVAILPQPDYKNPDSVTEFGRPKLGFLICAGNMDSMVNRYTVAKRQRATDAYTPGGGVGKRPDYATAVYGNLIKQRYKDLPVIIGGVEASLRRLAHYDYWSDSVKRSVVLDSQADLLIYGMGEKAICEAADALRDGRPLTGIRGTARPARSIDGLEDYIRLPSYEKISENKQSYAKSFYIQYQNTDQFTAKMLVEGYRDGSFVIQEPPQFPLTTAELDAVYELPYMRACHPSYEPLGGIPALTEVKFSLTSCRGCFGCCSFCSLSFHQGRIIQARSHESLLKEAELLTRDPDFKGYINDVGGPTANFRRPACDKQLKCGACKDRQCLFPEPCPNLVADQSDYTRLLQELAAVKGVKKVFVRSGVRFDYLLADSSDDFLIELVKNHVSGQLKVAPEHVSDKVLRAMGKPPHRVYLRFLRKYGKVNERLGKKQYIVPYLMSSHPGCGLKEAVELAEYLRDTGHEPEQVQDFYPTPSTVSTCMFYTGLDPRTLEPIYVTKDPHEKAMQRALMQYREPKNYELVAEALRKAGRADLIGFGPKCLIKPRGQASPAVARPAAPAKGAQRRKTPPRGGRKYR